MDHAHRPIPPRPHGHYHIAWGWIAFLCACLLLLSYMVAGGQQAPPFHVHRGYYQPIPTESTTP